MKVQVIYTSLTGCTRKLAQAIYSGIQAEEKSIHNLKDGIPVLDGDVILVGYWGKSGGPEPDMQAFLKTIKGKAVGVFCTLACYADSEFAHQTLDTGVDLLKYDNHVIGSYVCNGATSPDLIKRNYPHAEYAPDSQQHIRWDLFKNHPTDAECVLGAERFRERILLYRRCVEQGLEFKSIL